MGCVAPILRGSEDGTALVAGAVVTRALVATSGGAVRASLHVVDIAQLARGASPVSASSVRGATWWRLGKGLICPTGCPNRAIRRPPVVSVGHPGDVTSVR